jgi:glycine dehydrogenase
MNMWDDDHMLVPVPKERVDMGESTRFQDRHIGPTGRESVHMAHLLGFDDVGAVIDATVPDSIRRRSALALPEALSEPEVIEELTKLANLNQPLVSMIGLGYHDTHTPGVLQRNILENPGWYTSYTPYQPEISQGRLEALLAFQTMVEDLTGLPVAGASLLDEPTAAAEAMTLLRRTSRHDGNPVFVVDHHVHPTTLAVLQTRAEPLDISVVVADVGAGLPDVDAYGVLLSYPQGTGAVSDIRPAIEDAHSRGWGVAVTTDLLALTVLTPPGEMGADVVVGSAQRFGVPMGFGGPHAAFMSVRAGWERHVPGRLVGVSLDADGTPAYRLALQTREQHIRREKATSNICTAQALLAVVAAMYAAYHGSAGLVSIATRVHTHARILANAARELGVDVLQESFFDTIQLRLPSRAREYVHAARERGINIRIISDDVVSISTDEVTTSEHINDLIAALVEITGSSHTPEINAIAHSITDSLDDLPASVQRTSPFLAHPIFTDHHSETAMMRYLRRLSDRDLALDRTMIPLGSCTMKLNAVTEMAAITWPGFARMHPFAPVDQAQGYLAMISDLESWLANITGYDAVSLQPNAGSQGEFAGLLAIRAYHRSRGEAKRNVCLIPSSAHGTNAASAVMAGMQVVVVACDSEGNVDVADLARLIDEHRERLSALMITYPSTHGVFEVAVSQMCELVHDAGGQVYVDGANLNALVGLAAPGHFGADVSHLNLHKTFCIPHGGGGPGVGPIGVRSHLAAFLPSTNLRNDPDAVGEESVVGPVSGAPWGSAGILPIPWAYLKLMGAQGLVDATSQAILSANYLAQRLDGAFPVLYRGTSGLVAHECIIDIRPLTKLTGVSVDDIAKRLIDYGFHAPTMSFPVSGTLMIEPTESENLAELDRFVSAMLAIRAEIAHIESGEWPVENSPLRHAPHTVASLIGEWDHPYSREQAAFPLQSLRTDRYWPPVRRIDSAFGDRNLVCSCPAPEAFAETT